MSAENKGFTLIEVLLAILLISVGSLATTKLLGSVVSSNHTSGTKAEVAVVARNIMNRAVASISTGTNPAALNVVNQPYAGNADISYDVNTNVTGAAPSQVIIIVTVRHIALTKGKVGAGRGSFVMRTVVMAPV